MKRHRTVPAIAASGVLFGLALALTACREARAAPSPGPLNAANHSISRTGGSIREGKDAATPSICDAPDGDSARFESWGKHFAVYEELPGGDLVRLGADIQFVDVNSAIVIRRISETPTIHSANSALDAEWDDPQGLDIDVIALRPTSNNVCRIRYRTPGLQTTAGYDRAQKEAPGCPQNYKYFTEPGEVAKDARWRIPAGIFQHGDNVEIQLRGRVIGEEEFSKAAAKKVAIKATQAGKEGKEKDVDVDAFYQAKRTICGQSWTANFAVIDFGRIAPAQVRHGKRHALDGRNERADTRYAIYVDFPPEITSSLASGLFNSAVAITATAVDKDGKARDLALRKNTDRPMLDSPVDGDTVVVKVARKYASASGPSEIVTHSYSFAAVSGGLHAAASGENKATFGTTPSFVTVFRNDGKSPVYGFAQTFSYTATRRTIEPSFFDEFGFGIHVSVLARKSTSNAEGDADTPLSLGVGGHVSFGSNSIQIGAGWDLINEKVYATIGLSVPDLATFLDKK